jgi:hypothetical protein
MMSDGRQFTDYRSSQVREELFKYNNFIVSENEGRTLRIENANDMLDNEWKELENKNLCHPNKQCYHHSPITKVTTVSNNEELLRYNGIIPNKNPCPKPCKAMRATRTKGSIEDSVECKVVNHCDPTKFPTTCSKKYKLFGERWLDQ